MKHARGHRIVAPKVAGSYPAGHPTPLSGGATETDTLRLFAPPIGSRSAPPFVQRFLDRVEVMESGCWEWQSSRNENGYGIIQAMSPGDPSIPLHMRAHRLSYLLHFGPPPDDRLVLHTCDNPPCVNPEHLYLGTAKDNAQDMLKRGRNHWAAKTHCAQGHPFDAENTYLTPRTGHRQCRICREAWRKKSRAA
jgi:hypothetical protein